MILKFKSMLCFVMLITMLMSSENPIDTKQQIIQRRIKNRIKQESEKLLMNQEWSEEAQTNYANFFRDYYLAKHMNVEQFMTNYRPRPQEEIEYKEHVMNHLNKYIMFGINVNDNEYYRFLMNLETRFVKIYAQERGEARPTIKYYGDISKFFIKDFLTFPVFVVHYQDYVHNLDYFTTLYGLKPEYNINDHTFSLNQPEIYWRNVIIKKHLTTSMGEIYPEAEYEEPTKPWAFKVKLFVSKRLKNLLELEDKKNSKNKTNSNSIVEIISP